MRVVEVVVVEVGIEVRMMRRDVVVVGVLVVVGEAGKGG